ncbi:exodeoxyribonuclease VII large subunit [Pseudomonas xanthosomatis]|uniref:exodeoxyribonuclease VII large subunit n=1 Tax=Pseudomonas xanthosomatis TaxID=2842356 RepID=UPI003514E9B4
MNDLSNLPRDTVSTLQPVLTPESLNNLLKLTAPTDAITVKGIALEVQYWKKPGETTASKIYGRLGGLGEASIRFELQPYASIKVDDAVVLHGALRIKPFEAFRTTHEVVLVGDVAGSWTPCDASQEGEHSRAALAPLVRQQPRATLESTFARNGLQSVAFLVNATAWQDLGSAAKDLQGIGNCRQVTTNFMQPGRFLADLAKVCSDPTIKVLVIARGGGEGLATIGNSHEVASALLASGRVFYTALGHDKDVLLLDKHADQAFATPSVFGQALLEAHRTIREQASLTRRVQFLTQNVESLTRQNAELSAAPKVQVTPTTSPSNTRYLTWGLLLLVVFVLGRCTG